MDTIRRKIYVTEPDMINMTLARELLTGEGYELVEGSTDFSKNHATDCEVLLIRSKTLIKHDIFDFFPELKHVIRVGVGLDNVDADSLMSHNAKIYNSPGANSDAVAEYVVTMLLATLRRTTSLLQDDAASWNRLKFMGRSVMSQKVGIVGFGHIGRLLQQKLHGLGCREFIVYDPYLPADFQLDETVRKVDNLDDLLRQSTVVSLHLPLLESTRYIINAQNLSLLPEGAILINAARGGIVNEHDLLTVIDKKKLTYIADTVENEPHVSPALLGRDNVIVTPHIASLTEEANQTMLKVAINNFLEGRAIRQS